MLTVVNGRKIYFLAVDTNQHLCYDMCVAYDQHLPLRLDVKGNVTCYDDFKNRFTEDEAEGQAEMPGL